MPLSKEPNRLRAAADFEPVLLGTPYLSQWDANAHFSRGDCGIVSVAMCAQQRGSELSPDQIIEGARLPIGAHSYSFNQLLTAASYVQCPMVFRPGATWPLIEAHLTTMHKPVISLLRYGEISGNQDDFDGAHFWVVVGFDGENVITNDPNWWGERRMEGYRRKIPLLEFKTAIGSPLVYTGNQAYQSLFVL